MPLPPGQYELEILPPRAHIDRSVGVVTVGAAAGVTVVRDYVDSIEPDLLGLRFAENTSRDVRLGILAEYGLSALPGTDSGTFILVRVSGQHPQLVGEAIVRTHAEVDNFSLSGWDCPQ